MTLSESQALDSFDFLGDEDAALLNRMSRVSFSEGSEGTCECANHTVHCDWYTRHLCKAVCPLLIVHSIVHTTRVLWGSISTN